MDEQIRVSAKDGGVFMARRLSGADADALRRFNQELTDADRARFTPHAYTDEALTRILSRSENGVDLILGLFEQQASDGVAAEPLRMAGYFFLWYFQEKVPLLGIGLLRDFQGRGLGSKMMNILLKQAMAAGRDGVALTTMPDNHSAFALYEKCGFRYYADVNNLAGDGRIVVERAMFYAIKPGAQPLNITFAPPV